MNNTMETSSMLIIMEDGDVEHLNQPPDTRLA